MLGLKQLISFSVLTLVPCSGVLAEMSRGQEWVRSHRFQIGAFSDVPVEIEQYKSFGFSAYAGGIRLPRIETDYPLAVMGAARKAGLDTHWFTWYALGDQDALVDALTTLNDKIPGLVAHSLGDENDPLHHEELSGVLDTARAKAPEALIYHAMRGKDFLAEYAGDNSLYADYVRSAASVLKPDVLMFNMYPFYRGGTANFFFENLAIVREAALETGVPYWNWLQGFAWTDGPFHSPSESEARLQAFASLAYGYSGLFYWTYISPYKPYAHCLLDHQGQITPTGEAVRSLVPEVARLGEVIKGLRSTEVLYVPGQRLVDGEWKDRLPVGVVRFTPNKHSLVRTVASAPDHGGFLLGFFKDDEGADYVMVVNCRHGQDVSASDAAAALTLRFGPRVESITHLSRKTGEYLEVPLVKNELQHHVLPGGTGDLFRIQRRK